MGSRRASRDGIGRESGAPLPGVRAHVPYQELFFADGVIPGTRESAARWDAIAEHIPADGVMLDVGSNSGYFTVRAALEHPGLAVVSLEAATGPSADQRAVLHSHGIRNVVQLQGSMSGGLAQEWATTCDLFDFTLLLAILHWVDDPRAVLEAMSKMSRSLIIEIPDARDEGAGGVTDWRSLWGADPVRWVADVTGRNADLLLRPGRHTSEQPSYLILVTGDVTRRPFRAYWGSEFAHPSGRDYEVGFKSGEGYVRIRGKNQERVRGVNLVNLMRLGRLVYPGAGLITAQVREAMTQSEGHPDPLPHNMLWGAEGVTLIDADDLRGAHSSRAASRAARRNIAAWGRGTSVRQYTPLSPRSWTYWRERLIAWVRLSAPPWLIIKLRSQQHRRARL